MKKIDLIAGFKYHILVGNEKGIIFFNAMIHPFLKSLGYFLLSMILVLIG